MQATRHTSPPRLALSYVNPYLEHREDGTVSARAFFRGRGRAVAHMQAAVSQMRRGGVRLVLLSHGINEPDLFPGAAGVDYMLRCLEALVSEIEAHPDCLLVRTPRDLKQAERQRKLGIVLHLTGCPINGSLQVLRAYARLGVRAVHPFIRDDTFGGDCARHANRGLTKMGRTLLREMEEHRLIMDTAHANNRTFRDVVRMARRPIIDSHVGCRAILKSARNRTDRQLAALGEAGGLVGVHFGSKLLTPLSETNRTRQLKKMQREVAAMRRRHRDPYVFMAKRYDPYRWPRILGGAIDDGIEPARASLGHVVDHLDRMVRFAGAQHVCIGSDYALGAVCAGVETADRLPNLARALRDRGYGDTQRNQLLYQNVRRLLMSALPPD